MVLVLPSLSAVKLVAYFSGVVLAAVHYIALDIVCVISLAYGVTLARPLPRLGPSRPTGSLLGPAVLASVFGQHLLNLGFLGGALLLMQQAGGYVRWGPLTPDEDRPIVYSEGRAWWFLGARRHAFARGTR